MDLSSKKYAWLYLSLGFALMFVWTLISVANAHERSLVRVNDSFTKGSRIVNQLGAISDDLGRLGVDQRAFLSTGDMRFQDGVIESSERLMIETAMLNSLAAKYNLKSAGLSQSIDLVLRAVGESDEIAVIQGKGAAVAFLDSRESLISDARGQTDHLRAEITGTISDRIQNARRTKAFLEDLLYVSLAGMEVVRGARTTTH